METHREIGMAFRKSIGKACEACGIEVDRGERFCEKCASAMSYPTIPRTRKIFRFVSGEPGQIGELIFEDDPRIERLEGYLYKIGDVVAATLKGGVRCLLIWEKNDTIPEDTDPHGIDQHAPGAKLDAGKPRVGLMLDGFALALMEVAKVTTYGAGKYTPSGWESVPDGEARYKDALLRHLLQSGHEELDPESGLPHLAHCAWGALALLELHLRGKQS